MFGFSRSERNVGAFTVVDIGYVSRKGFTGGMRMRFGTRLPGGWPCYANEPSSL
jgi:hypothetical protein